MCQVCDGPDDAGVLPAGDVCGGFLHGGQPGEGGVPAWREPGIRQAGEHRGIIVGVQRLLLHVQRG